MGWRSTVATCLCSGASPRTKPRQRRQPSRFGFLFRIHASCAEIHVVNFKKFNRREKSIEDFSGIAYSKKSKFEPAQRWGKPALGFPHKRLSAGDSRARKTPIAKTQPQLYAAPTASLLQPAWGGVGEGFENHLKASQHKPMPAMYWRPLSVWQFIS